MQRLTQLCRMLDIVNALKDNEGSTVRSSAVGGSLGTSDVYWNARTPAAAPAGLGLTVTRVNWDFS